MRLVRGALAAIAAAMTMAWRPSAERPSSGALQVVVEGPAGDTLASATPVFRVRARDVTDADRPIQLAVQFSPRADFTGGGIIEYTATGDSATIIPERPLPSRTTIYWRARARSALGDEHFSTVSGPRTTAAWITLVFPNPVSGGTLDTRRPTFRWTSAPITSPPGPWRFFVSVENLATRQVHDFGPLGGDRLTIPIDLETNTSYHWAVTGALPTGENEVARSSASFVILEQGAPRVTLLYQNFPNPFPNATSSTTCFWFDLHEASTIRLTIHDIRGNLVRTIVPSGVVTGAFLPGRYGRGIPGGSQSCDPRFAWDGQGDNGRYMGAGVYLVRLKTRSVESYKKILFRGR